MIYLTPALEKANPQRARSSAGQAESRRAPVLADLTIADKLGHLVKFDPLPAQARIREMIVQQRAEIEAGKRPWGRVRLVVVKARQMGISTEAQAQLFAAVASRPFSHALTIAHVSESAAHLHGIATRFYRTLPDNLRPERQAQNARGITFAPPLESRLGIEVVGEGAGRSRTLHGLHASEVALWPGDVRETLAALRGGLVSEPWCLEILESTGYGLGGGFYDEYQAAKKDGRALFFPWFEDPRYRTRPALTLDDIRRMGGEREAIEHIEATVEKVSRLQGSHTEGPQHDAVVPGLQSQRDALSLGEVRGGGQAHGLDGEQLAWLASKLLGEYGGDVRRFKREFPATEEEAFTGDARQVFSESIIGRVDAAIAATARWTDHGMAVPSGADIARLDTLGVGALPGDAPGRHLVRCLVERGGPDSAYVIGADPAEGLEHGDDSALVVIDRVRRRVCACARTGLDPDEFATLLSALGRYYNQAYICVELNNHGYAVIMRLRDLGYPLIWRERLNEAVDSHVISNFGYRTTAGSKARAVGSLIANVRSGLLVPFPEIREQLVTYVRDEKGKMGAVPGCKDDLVSALWLASIAADELGVTDPVTAKMLELRAPRMPKDFTKGVPLGAWESMVREQCPDWSLDGGGGGGDYLGSEVRRR